MLTIEQLDAIKQSPFNSIEKGKCSCGSIDAVPYAYKFSNANIDVYWECEKCLEKDIKEYKYTKIIKLSLKEIFYLKC